MPVLVLEAERRQVPDDSKPGVSRGTSTIDCCRCEAASGSVLPIRMKILQRSSAAPEIHHLRPLMT